MNVRRNPASVIALAVAVFGLLATTPTAGVAQDRDDRRDNPPPAGPVTGPPSVTDDVFSDAPDTERDRRERFDRDDFQRMMENVMDVIADIDPEMADRIRRHRDDNPRASMGIIRDKFPEAFWLVRLRHDDPAMYALRVDDLKLYRRSEVLAKQLREARREDPDGDVADDLTDALTETIEQHFEVQNTIHELEVERLEARIDALKDAIRDRDRREKELIEKRLNRLLEERPDREDRRRDRDRDDDRRDDRRGDDDRRD